MSMLLFYVGENKYAIDSCHILRIIPLVTLKKMPTVPYYMAGLLNLGGKVVPVVDFCQLIEKRASHFILSTRIIIAKDPTADSKRTVGIMGEHIKDFLYTHLEKFDPTDFNLSPFAFLNRIYNKQGEIIHYLDLEQFFTFLSNDLFQLKETHEV